MSRILIIDDSELINNLLKEALTAAGYEVAQALDANQGYAVALEFHPDLILLDVQLPDVQGFDLIRVIKNRDQLRHVPIIMITGTHHQTDHKVKAFQAGADDYVLKPFEMPELIERVAAVLRRSQPPANAEPPHKQGGRQPSHVEDGVRTWTPARYGADEPTSSPAAIGGGPILDPRPVSAGDDDKSITVLTLRETVYQIFTAPQTLSPTTLPPVTFISFSAILGLSLGGWVLSAGSSVKPAVIGIGAAGLWGMCIVFLVMSCSIMGISLRWREGGRLFSAASVPLILKLLGGLVVALTTSLTPFYFTASPAIFLRSPSILLERLDLFEIWTIWLLWILVKQCKGSSPRKAWVAAAIVWPVLAWWQTLWHH